MFRVAKSLKLSTYLLSRNTSKYRSVSVATAVSPFPQHLRTSYATPLTHQPSRLLRQFSTNAETREFQAETRKILDIVTHSVYTDKEVFLRELISNASDALEKFRYKQVNSEVSSSNSVPLEINIQIDTTANTITMTDTGIGMTREELISNLGTIARSGSKAFVEELRKDSGSSSSREGDSIIGQFGVGFYSSFMVSDKVTVESISALESQSDKAVNKWSSDGSGMFTIETAPESELKRGSRITMYLKESCKEFASVDKVKTIIKKYSNFVSFPIKVNDEAVNTVSALWLQDKKDISKSQYKEFYKFISNAFDEPRYTLHFRSDAPIDLKCLFFIPTFHHEKFGMGRIEPAVNLYSRKVLIESKPKDLLPEWLRFIKGVVDSEDLPLSLSREKPQDSNLLRRIREVLTRKVIRFLEDQAKSDAEKYKEFYIEFNYFLKEGVCQDHTFMDQIVKLLRFESSAMNEGELVSLDDYIARSTPDDKHIYYLVAPNREAAFQSPYYETFKKHGKEVLLLYNSIDDFVMTNIRSYNGRELTSAENSTIDLGKDKVDEAEKDKIKENALSEDEAKQLCEWITTVLGERVREVKTTTRLSDSPAIVTDHQSGALRKMMKMLDQSNSGAQKSQTMPPQVFEINPSHPLIVNIFKTKDQNDGHIAKLVAEQLFDNAMIAAGLVDDARSMIPRLNEILKSTLTKSTDN
jgi:TNF receptor-associated protein 1